MPIPSRLSAAAVLTAAVLAACSDQNPAGTSAQATVATLATAYTAPAEPVNGEFIRQSGLPTVYLVFNQTLYGVPDMQTLIACTGGYDKVVREVSSLPGWTQRTLPSAGNPQARPHGRAWMHGDRPVKNSLGTIYLIVGCVRAGIPTQSVYQSTFGDLDFSRAVTVADADLNALPEGPQAVGHPLRRAGTLLNDTWVKWVTYHGGSLGVPDPPTMDSYCRPWADLVTTSPGEHGWYAQPGLRQSGTGCLRGDDYPYKSASSYPSASYDLAWRYYYRQCTSFAAWRLNQEGIEFHNQFRNRHFGHAYMWADTARAAGLTVNNTPRRGAIAQWNAASWNGNYGHVAYVAAVENSTGYITIEEYNYSAEAYSWRRVPASSVSNFIHFR